jgi:hypothetical protein
VKRKTHKKKILVTSAVRRKEKISQPKIMYKTDPTMHPSNAATMVFKSEEEVEEEEEEV